jgi:hypothetical protein
LRATLVRIAAAKTAGQLDVNRPIIFQCTWGGGNVQYLCENFPASGTKKPGKKGATEKDVSQLLEQLRISPGAGLISDGTVKIHVGSSDV